MDSTTSDSAALLHSFWWVRSNVKRYPFKAVRILERKKRGKKEELHSEPVGCIPWEFHPIYLSEMKTTILVVFRSWFCCWATDELALSEARLAAGKKQISDLFRLNSFARISADTLLFRWLRIRYTLNLVLRIESILEICFLKISAN